MDRERRLAVVWIRDDDIADMVSGSVRLSVSGLPVGAKLVRVGYEFQYASFAFVYEHEDFDPVPEGAMAPGLRDVTINRVDLPPASDERRPIWEVIGDLVGEALQEELKKLPRDGASQHDHYIYGTSKK